MECENWDGGTSMPFTGDHAGAWETSVMMFAHEHRTDPDELRRQMEASGRADMDRMEMKEAEGIGGWNPLRYASADLGKKIVDFCADRIGRKALAVLEGRIQPPARADGRFLDNPGPTDRPG